MENYLKYLVRNPLRLYQVTRQWKKIHVLNFFNIDLDRIIFQGYTIFIIYRFISIKPMNAISKLVKLKKTRLKMRENFFLVLILSLSYRINNN